MIILRLGDPHTQKSNLEESERLLTFVKETVLSRKVDRLEILGDLTHNHSVMRVEVLNFWNKWLKTLSIMVETVVLVGNHDLANPTDPKTHSLIAFKNIESQNLKIVDGPMTIRNFTYIPYIHSSEEFIHLANKNATQVLVCHQTFSGSKFENGFYAPDGINPDLIESPLIISGHVHARQRFGKVIYPGTSTWQSSSDANQEKGLWLVEHHFDGHILNEEFIDTSAVVTPILSYIWLEGEAEPIIPENSRATVELVGSSAWISKQKTKLKGKVGIKSKITDQKRSENRKTGKSFSEYLLSKYETKMDRNAIFEYGKSIGVI